MVNGKHSICPICNDSNCPKIDQFVFLQNQNFTTKENAGKLLPTPPPPPLSSIIFLFENALSGVEIHENRGWLQTLMQTNIYNWTELKSWCKPTPTIELS